MSKSITLEILKGLKEYHQNTLASEATADSDEYHNAREDLSKVQKAIAWVKDQNKGT